MFDDSAQHNDPAGDTVRSLVEGARRGDQAAWDALIKRYLPLVMAVTRAYRLRHKDAEDVVQIVWLRLIEHLGRLREPRALPKWILTTARHESQRVAAGFVRTIPASPLLEEREDRWGDPAEVEAELLRAEAQQAIRDGLAELPREQRRTLLLLAADPPLSYRQISQILDMPQGSIGPTRARYLRRLRETSAMRQFLGGSA